MANKTRLKIGKVGDITAIVLPRGNALVFEKGESEMAKAIFKDFSQYGRDCVGSGMLWGSAATLIAIGIIKARKKLKKRRKRKEMELEADAE